MKVLHVASFRGNIGDNANHAGFRPWFESMLGQAPEWIEFEICDVYRKTRAFDADFAKQANTCDLVVIGGGNYFELWVENSPTGTSISVPDDVMDAIKPPIFINALGWTMPRAIPKRRWGASANSWVGCWRRTNIWSVSAMTAPWPR